MYMSKQYPMEEWAPQSWLFQAKGYYLQMLRDAAAIERLEQSTRPKEVGPAAAELPADGGLFRFGRMAATAITCTDSSPGTLALHPHDSAATTTTATATNAEGLPQATQATLDESDDVVTEEVSRWLRLDKWSVREVTDIDGVVNEMALHYKLRRDFPLHFRVFKQVSSHMCHEGNTERLFSLAGNLSDENGKMSPENLAIWTSVGANRAIYTPSVDEVMKRYFKLFSNTGFTQTHATAQPDA